jgi:hypothetical protein
MECPYYCSCMNTHVDNWSWWFDFHVKQLDSTLLIVLIRSFAKWVGSYRWVLIFQVLSTNWTCLWSYVVWPSWLFPLLYVFLFYGLHNALSITYTRVQIIVYSTLIDTSIKNTKKKMSIMPLIILIGKKKFLDSLNIWCIYNIYYRLNISVIRWISKVKFIIDEVIRHLVAHHHCFY